MIAFLFLFPMMKFFFFNALSSGKEWHELSQVEDLQELPLPS